MSRDFEQIFEQIVSVRIKTLGNTNMVTSRLIKREKGSLPVDVRRSKTSLLKLPNVFLSLFLLARGTLKFLFLLKLDLTPSHSFRVPRKMSCSPRLAHKAPVMQARVFFMRKYMAVLPAKKRGPNNEVTVLPGRKAGFHCTSYLQICTFSIGLLANRCVSVQN